MKKSSLIFICLTLIASVLVGCTDFGSSKKEQETHPNEDNNHAVLDLLSKSIEDLESYTSINLHKINDRFSLVELVQNMMGDVNYLVDHSERRFTSSRFFLVDHEAMEIQDILWEGVDIIETVFMQNDRMIFSYTGANMHNGFKVFPYYRVYDFSNRELIEKQIFKDLNHSTEVGGYTNSMDLESIVAMDQNSITFSFIENQGTIVAGGAIFPQVKMGMIEDEFYIDMQNVHLTAESEQILSTFNTPIIESIRTKTYSDERNQHHLVLYIKLKEVQQYSCELDAEGISGKLTILFQ